MKCYFESVEETSSKDGIIGHIYYIECYVLGVFGVGKGKVLGCLVLVKGIEANTDKKCRG
jgi:hypothetical protein